MAEDDEKPLKRLSKWLLGALNGACNGTVKNAGHKKAEL